MTESILLGNLVTSKSESSARRAPISRTKPNRPVAKPGKLPSETVSDKHVELRSISLTNNKVVKSNVKEPRQINWNIRNIEKPVVERKEADQVDNRFRTSRLFDHSNEEIADIETIQMEIKHEELFSEAMFADMKLHKHVVACLEQRFTLTKATKVQALSIPALLSGRDALIKSVTGSGKTLAYCIPMVEALQAVEPAIQRTSGLKAIIVLPTRELAIQTYECLDRLLQPFRRIVATVLIGGEKKKSEKNRIRKGVNILVTTPGRLVDHLDHTKNLRLDQLSWFVIDEADRLYEQGFSAMMGQIIEKIKEKCSQHVQTVLLSATLSEGVKELAGLSLQQPEMIDVSDATEHKLDSISLPSSLTNSYMLVPPKLRLVTLATILLSSIRSGSASKIIVFMSCQDVVDFYSTILNSTLQQFCGDDRKIRILQLRGNMSQSDRTQVFRKFHDALYGVLFCTDVASRGLDLPNVDLVVQTSAPGVVEDYVHRVGRTARVGNQGQSVMFVLPSETNYIPYLQQQIKINFDPVQLSRYFKVADELEFNRELHTNQERVAYLQQIFERAVIDSEELHELGTKAYRSHLRAYASYPREMGRYLPFRQLHLGHLAKSFALRESPSELGAKKLAHGKKGFGGRNRQQDIHSMKRNVIPLEIRVSEFASGDSPSKRFKRK